MDLIEADGLTRDPETGLVVGPVAVEPVLVSVEQRYQESVHAYGVTKNERAIRSTACSEALMEHRLIACNMENWRGNKIRCFIDPITLFSFSVAELREAEAQTGIRFDNVEREEVASSSSSDPKRQCITQS